MPSPCYHRHRHHTYIATACKDLGLIIGVCARGIDVPLVNLGIIPMHFQGHVHELYDNIAGQARAIKIQKTVGRPCHSVVWPESRTAELTALSRVQLDLVDSGLASPFQEPTLLWHFS